MLVYGKGQLFLPHQDSEKDDAMVGTLVVSLPSAHTGGELVIDHAGQSNAYRASTEELTFVAFYADSRHQVTPVRSGYRVSPLKAQMPRRRWLWLNLPTRHPGRARIPRAARRPHPDGLHPDRR
jgi:2OG-Fe(II) oxygenase superfamily